MLTYLWNFGDGQTSTLENPSHTYATPGAYTVTLRATNEAGSDTFTRQNYINVVAATQVTSTRDTYWRTSEPGIPVTSSRATSWRLDGRPESVRGASWTTRSSVTSTREVRFANLVPVGNSRATYWSAFALATGATVLPTMRLKAYAPNGADLGSLPTPEGVSASYVLNDVGGLSCSYAPTAPKASLLGQPCEIAVEVSPDAGTTWIEPPNSRFLYLSDGRDPLNRTDRYAISAKSWIWRLEKARVLPNGALNAEGKRAFNAVTPGTLLKTLFNEAGARGALVGVDHSSFTTTTDSSGVAWSKQLTIAYEPGLSYLTVLQNLADQGFVDFRTQGRAIQVFNADGAMAVDRTVGTIQVAFRAGRDLSDAPFRRTWEGLANYAYFAGDGVSYEFTNPGAEAPWGRWETFVSNGSVKDLGTMAALTQSELSMSDAGRTEYTRGLDFSRARSKPLWDYDVGNYVWSTVDGSLPDRLRIRQITLTNNDKNILSGNVVLNDRFLEADIRQKRRVEGITNGASSGTGTGGPDTDPGDDKVPPAKVSGLVASSAAYLGLGGFAQAQVSLSWAVPTTNADSTVIDDLDHYEIFERPSTSPVGSEKHVATTTDSSLDRSPYVPGSNWFFSVVAVDTSGNRSVKSNELQVGMAQDTTPPQTPSAPLVTARLGTVRVFWDGLPSVGSWPRDFDHVEVHVSTVNNFTPVDATLTDTLFAEGYSILTGYPYGVPIYIKLIAVDKVGLKSSPSLQAIGTPTRLVGSDVDANAIGYEQLAFKEPGNVLTDGSFETQLARFTIGSRSSAAWTFTTADFFHGDYSITVDGSVNSGTVRTVNLMTAAEAQSIQGGETLFMRMAYKATSGANGNVYTAIQWISATGTTTTSTTGATTRDGTWRTAAGKFTAPAGTQSFRVYLEMDAGATVGSWWVDAVEIRRTVDTSIIEDAAITNALIANLAVNSAKISDLAVGKLVAGTMTADVLLAGRFRTASSGNRVEFDSTGIRMYRGTMLTGHWNTVTGQLRIYNETDATHTSSGHGMQFGDNDGQNLVIDNNEIMGRFNGDFGQLLLNREGGNVNIGGKKGGFNPDGSDFGQIPKNDDHVIQLRGHVQVWNSGSGDYADEFPPLVVGPRGLKHLFMDSDVIGSSTGDGVASLYLQPPRAGGVNHTMPVWIGSNAIYIRRISANQGGIFCPDGNTALQFFNGQINARDTQLAGNRSMGASAFNVLSQQNTKTQITDIVGPLATVKAVRSRKWKFRKEINPDDRWHYGPMLEDLPEELHVQIGGNQKGYDLGSLVGLLWEANRELLARVEALEKEPKSVSGR